MAHGDARTIGLSTETIAGEDWKLLAQERFAVTLVDRALAPTNTLLGNPAAFKRAFDTAGRRASLEGSNYVTI